MKLTTKRLTIRPFIKMDIDNFMAYRNDMNWMRYQGFKGLTKQEYQKVLLGDSTLQSGMQLAVICNTSNELIGDVYLKQEYSDVWIGYTVCPSKARQGFACEMVSAVIHSLKSTGIVSVLAGVDLKNTASIELLKKLNFTYSKTEDEEQIYMLHLK